VLLLGLFTVGSTWHMF